MEFNNSDRLTAEWHRSFERLVRPFGIANGVTIPIGQYHFDDGLVSYALGPQHRASGTVSLQQGQFYDGHVTIASYSGGRVSLTQRLAFEPTVSINRVRLAYGNFTTKLVRARTDYAFTSWMFATALLQYNTADNSFSNNLRLRWEYRPGSEFFAVYTDERDTTARGLPLLKNRAFILKINRQIMF